MLGGNKKVTNTCVTFLFPPGINGLKFKFSTNSKPDAKYFPLDSN